MDTIDQQGGIQEGLPPLGQAWFISRHGHSWSPAGDFAGRYMTDRSTRYDDGLIGPFPSVEAARDAAEARNRELDDS